MGPHIFLKFYKFCRILFHFFVNSFLFVSSLWLKIFSSYKLSNFLRDKHNIWKVIKDDLVSKILYHQLEGGQDCGDNEGIRRFILKYSITAHHNRLVLKQWAKRWMTHLAFKLPNEQSKLLCSRYKKDFDEGTEYCVNFILKTLQLRMYCSNTWKSMNMFLLQSQNLKHTFVRLVWFFHVEVISNKALSRLALKNVFDCFL